MATIMDFEPEAEARPVVAVANCCGHVHDLALVVCIKGAWFQLVGCKDQATHQVGIGVAHKRLNRCRGCWKSFGPETPTVPYTWGEDDDIENVLTLIARGTDDAGVWKPDMDKERK